MLRRNCPFDDVFFDNIQNVVFVDMAIEVAGRINDQIAGVLVAAHVRNFPN